MKILQCGPTASGDTTKTEIGTIRVPTTSSKIVGVSGQHLGAATLTTGENVSGLLEVESDDNMVVCRIPFCDAAILTSGALSNGGNSRFTPVDIDVTPGATLTVYVTMDMAQTGALKSRCAVMFS